MSAVVATICRLCPVGDAGLAARLQRAFAAAGLAVETRQVDCMSGCARPAALAFRAAGKTAYLFGDVTEADLPDILTFARLYLANPDGNLADARPLGALRNKVIARIPP